MSATANINPLTLGIKQVLNNIPAKSLVENSQSFVDYKIFQGYKLLKDIMSFEGNLVMNVQTAPNVDTTYKVEYCADHFYRLIQNFLMKLNANINVKQQNDLSFNRLFQVFENIGHLPFCDVPTEITIKANQTQGSAPFRILIPFWFIMPDMIGSTQTFIYLPLFATMQSSFNVGDTKSIIYQVKNGNNSVYDRLNPNVATDPSFTIDNTTISSASEFWIVDFNYLKSATAGEVLAKMGKIYNTESITQTFTADGQNQYIKLMPTSQRTLKDLFIVCRDTKTGKRVDGLIKKIRIADGDRPLVDTSPIFLREGNLERYNLSWDFYNETDPTQPDNQGILYGVDRIDTSYFGELMNGQLATGNWEQPYLYLDLEGLANLEGDLQVEVYQSSVVIPASMQAQVNAYVGAQNSAM